MTLVSRSNVIGALALLAMLFAVTAVAEAAARKQSTGNRVNNLCQAANLKSLRFINLGSLDRLGDVCRRRASRIPSRIKVTLNQIAALYEMSRSRLVGLGTGALLKGIKLEIKSESAAFLASSSIQNTNSLKLGVFNSWNGGMINSSTYLHELGHLLAGPYASTEIALFGALASHQLLSEALPDEFALSVVGTLSPIKGNLQRYPWEGRVPHARFNYFAPISLLDGTQRIEDLFQFCRAVKSSAEARLIDRRFCRARETRLEVQHIDALDPAPLNFDSILEIATYEHPTDLHTLGFPIVSFLEEYRQTIGSRESLLLQLIAANYPTSEVEDTYKCMGSHLQKINYIKILGLAKVFKLVREDFLSSEQRVVFESLWDKYGMDIGMELAEAIELALAENRALFTLHNAACERVT
ncbi:MAG: hypothetical protein K1X83_03650 [Oligoflexia bacterium]|nr:hypothetical protein [Oligoflexia bacterium]